MIMSANNDQEIDAVIQALKKYYLHDYYLRKRNLCFNDLDIVQIRLNLLIIILVHPLCVYFIHKIKQI